MRVAVVGLGRAGLATAVALALRGHAVHGIEADAERAAALAAGRLPWYEPGLAEALARVRRGGRPTGSGRGGPAPGPPGRLEVHTEPRAVRGCGVVLLCVGTPPGPGGCLDVGPLEGAARAIAPWLREGAVVAVRSSVPPGTAERLEGLLRAAGAPPRVEVAAVPEFLREGSALADALRPDRLLIGAASPRAVARLRALLAGPGVPVRVTDRRTAELAKLATNAFLAARVSLINLFADLCEATGADVRHLAEAVGLDPRIGPHYLRAGVGYGGGCLPKDVRATIALCREAGCDPSLLEAVEAVNAARPSRMVRRLRALLAEAGAGAGERLRVAVLGLAFKPDTDDLRESPSLAVIDGLWRHGFAVTAYDPRAGEAFRATPLARRPGVAVAPDLERAVAGADAAVVVTPWPEIVAADWPALLRRMRRPLVVDACNALDPGPLRAAGARVAGAGRGG